MQEFETLSGLGFGFRLWGLRFRLVTLKEAKHTVERG